MFYQDTGTKEGVRERMTKETLERAKTLDGNIATIDKALNVLNNRQLRISSDITGFELKFNELDIDTLAELKAVMKDTLTKRKSSMINELKEL
jgi:hypothetical protein